MGVVGRLDQYASMLAWEFDDYSMSENLLQYSEDFSNAYWTKSNVSVTSNATTSPIGLSNATKLIESASTAVHELSRAADPVLSSGTDNYISFSIFAKAAERQYCYIRAIGNSKRIAVVVDLSNGTFNVTNWGYTLNSSATVTAYPNGWYRITATAQSNYPAAPGWFGSYYISPLDSYQLAGNVGGAGYSYAGNGTSGIYIWGAQYEFSSTPTDYTPTTTTAINRVLASTTNTNITGLGTYYSSGFYENVGFATFLSANVFAPYDLVYDEFGGTLFGAGQGRYMRQNTDKSVIVYNEIDEVSDFRDIVRSGLVLDLDAGMNASYNGSGTTWTDLSGRGNNATRTNNGGYGGQATYNSSGYFDFSMNSPAVTAGAGAGNGFTMSSMIIPSTGNFTLSAFVRRNTSVKASGDRETIFSNTGDADGWRFGLGTGGYIYYLIGGVGGSGFQEGSLGGSTLDNGNWHMMTAVFDRAGVFGSYTIYGYVDGVSSGSATIGAGAGGNVAFSTQNPGVGYGGCCDVFAGQIATVSAYNRALSAAEVSQNYNALRNRFGL